MSVSESTGSQLEGNEWRPFQTAEWRVICSCNDIIIMMHLYSCLPVVRRKSFEEEEDILLAVMIIWIEITPLPLSYLRFCIMN